METAFGIFLIIALILSLFGMIYDWNNYKNRYRKNEDTLNNVLTKLPASYGEFYVKNLVIRKNPNNTWTIGYEKEGFIYTDKDLKTAAEALLLTLQEHNII